MERCFYQPTPRRLAGELIGAFSCALRPPDGVGFDVFNVADAKVDLAIVVSPAATHIGHWQKTGISARIASIGWYSGWWGTISGKPARDAPTNL
jgi:hypothetical protein